MPYDMRNPMNPMNSVNPGNEQMHHREIPMIMQDIDGMLVAHKCWNDRAMKACQMNGYNGFKRLHRYNAKKFFKMHLCLENEAYDKFRFVLPDKENDASAYSWGASLVDHLKRWDMQLDEDIDHLAMLNNEYRMCAGVGNCIAEKALCRMTKNHEKTGRWIKRFEETKSAHDQHELDDWLHEKYKAKEERKK